VFRDEVKILMDRDGRLIAATGYIPGKSEAGPAEARRFDLAASTAIGRALADFDGSVAGLEMTRVGEVSPEGVERYTPKQTANAAPDLTLPIRARKVLFHLPGKLVAAWYVELATPTVARSYVISGIDGSILMRHDMLAYDSFSYRVWADGTSLHAPLDGPQGNAPTPHPTALPDFYTPAFVPPVLLSLQNGPISTSDPWLAPGATTTFGNNCAAYADLYAPDGLSGADFFGTVTSPGVFDRTYDVNLAPGVSTAQQKAAITQVFFTNNFLHDWFYDAGFNESARNGQTSNYGRGGVQGDAVYAEVQDYSGRTNANMFTPADGGHPRMQMYVWDPPSHQITVTSPASVAGLKIAGGGSTNAANIDLQGSLARMSPATLSAAATTPFAVGTGPEWVTLVDVSSDGLRDLLTANYTTNDVTVRMNNGAGGFGAPTSYPMGNGPYTVTAGDFNNDGFSDMVTANNASNTISVRTSYGFLFSSATSYAAGLQPACAAVGKLNGDFFDDIVTANYGSNTVSVFLANGSGGFSAKVDYPVGVHPNWVAVGDINGDGKADLVTANYGANSISVLLGSGTGTFGPKTDYPTGVQPLTLSLGDLNGDNRLDVVTANTGANTLTTLLNGPGGIGAPSPGNAVPATPVTVVLRDVNGDGLLDAVVCCDVSNVIAVLPGKGTGNFGAAISYPVGTTPYGVAIDDVSGDGVPDLVSANYGSNDVTVIRTSLTDSSDPCAGYVNSPQSRVVLIEASNCSFAAQVLAAQNAGASAVVIAYSSDTVWDPDLSGVSIPMFMVTNTDGSAMRNALFKGPVLVNLKRSKSLERDSAIDDQIVAHEWAHYLSNRLIG
jgi:hypothetical protein